MTGWDMQYSSNCLEEWQNNIIQHCPPKQMYVCRHEKLYWQFTGKN